MVEAFLARKHSCELGQCAFERFLIRKPVAQVSAPVQQHRQKRRFNTTQSRSLVDILNKCTANNAHRMAIRYVQHTSVTEADVITVINKMVMHHEFVKVYMPVLKSIGHCMQDTMREHIAVLEDQVHKHLTALFPDRTVLARLKVLTQIAPETRPTIARMCGTQILAQQNNPGMLELLLQAYKLLNIRHDDVITFLSDHMGTFDNRSRFVALDIV